MELRAVARCFLPEGPETGRRAGLCREAVGAVYTDAETWPNIPDLTGDVVYARLQRGGGSLETAYSSGDLDAWAGRAKAWAQGHASEDLSLIDTTHQDEPKPRDVFVYFIHEGKLRAPAAAMALIERLA